MKKYIIISLILLLPTLSIIIHKKSKPIKSQKEIGILQIMEHDCLDLARKGFIDGLEELGYNNKKNIKIDYQNAQGDQSICNSIANNFVNSSQKDLILAISTPAAQSVANVTKTIPILITAVTDPQASGLVKSNNKPETNITGTSDMVAVEKQIQLIKKLLPNSKKVGILYSSNEINSKIQAELAAKEAEKTGIHTIDYNVSNSNELQQMLEHIGNSVDVIFVPTDNLVVSCMPLVSKIATSNGVPIICSESASVKNGALATYGIDFYELGKLTSKQAAKILNGELKPSVMPIKHLNNTKLIINYDVIDKLKITIPDELKEEMK